MKTEAKANDVTIRRYEVDDLPKTAKKLDGFVMRIKEFRNWMDCDVIFDDAYEDGTEATVCHICPGLYLTGNIHTSGLYHGTQPISLCEYWGDPDCHKRQEVLRHRCR